MYPNARFKGTNKARAATRSGADFEIHVCHHTPGARLTFNPVYRLGRVSERANSACITECVYVWPVRVYAVIVQNEYFRHKKILVCLFYGRIRMCPHTAHNDLVYTHIQMHTSKARIPWARAQLLVVGAQGLTSP